MCGIFGFVSASESNFSPKEFKVLIDNLFLSSESRGKDASGIMLFNNSDITILKRPLRAKQLLRTNEYKGIVKQFESQRRLPAETLGFVGHARMVTNGSEETHDNNQPVISHDMCILHNGIIVNNDDLWNEFPQIKRNYEVDTEVALNLIWHYRNNGLSFLDSFCKAFAHLKGANSFAFVSADTDALILATSNGSLYFSISSSGKELIFSSERYILEKTISDRSIKQLFERSEVVHVTPGEGYLFSFEDFSPCNFQLDGKSTNKISPKTRQTARLIHDLRPAHETKTIALPHLTSLAIGENDRFINRVNGAVEKLRRCTKCVLPETFPYIEFDKNGVCNFCNHYEPLRFKGSEALENVVKTYRISDGGPDCLVPISGGRDSCYGLHYVKNELKMNPVAYTYDWGMVTDLARRNISKMCGDLGVEHILISADIKTKRKYVRQNVLAWLKYPVLGTVPLFMAGDKQFFYYAQLLRKQMDLDLVLFSFNRLERTDFKVAFANIIRRQGMFITNTNKLQLTAYYAKEYLRNPAYINSSLLDTVFAFHSFYMIPKSFETLFDYIRWDEQIVNNTLIKEYNWEIAKDTDSTWRIGDGTASFYNYIYYVMAGFSENDTFKSNQIREGMLSRKEAMRSVDQDNQPRYESIQWYCDTIGIDMQSALKVINTAPKLYPIEA